MPQKVEICLEKRNHPEHKYFVTLNGKIVFFDTKVDNKYFIWTQK